MQTIDEVLKNFEASDEYLSLSPEEQWEQGFAWCNAYNKWYLKHHKSWY